MRKFLTIQIVLFLAFSCKSEVKIPPKEFMPFTPPVSYEVADKRADTVLAKLTLEEKIQMIGGYNFFYIKGYEQYGIPQIYLADATMGVHIREKLSGKLKKSTSFPSSILLASTWNTDLVTEYSKAIGEECRIGDIGVLLGPGMNIYRISQNGRSFEYFSEDPYLAARIIENFVVGLQSTGTIATLKHFLCNNNELQRRTTNVIADERTLHEIYLPAFKAGIDAGAMAIMTSYNQFNGEWAGQSDYVINNLLRKQLGYKWLVMTDWWSTWDPEKTIKSGQDLEMPGEGFRMDPTKDPFGDIFVKGNAKKLLDAGKVTEADINRMAKNIIRTTIAMGFYDRPIQDTGYLTRYDQHSKIALQAAREGIVLLKNENNLLPIEASKAQNIIVTGQFVTMLPYGMGAARVKGYDTITMLDALKKEFGKKINYIPTPTEEEIKNADVVLVSIGSIDREASDHYFDFPASTDSLVLKAVAANKNTVVIVNSGSGRNMTRWNDKVSAILYAWYPGQSGNIALAEIVSGKVNPSGKLPITIEKKFEDSPGFGYVPEGTDIATDWDDDMDMKAPILTLNYKEGIFVGYRWYESKKIEPLYSFGYGLSYTSFAYSDLTFSSKLISGDSPVLVDVTIKNSGDKAGSEIVQLYIQDQEASVPRPIKELKGFQKIFLEPGESKIVQFMVKKADLAFYDVNKSSWTAEPGEFSVLIGSSSDNILLEGKINLE